jgi:hypothetical protein
MSKGILERLQYLDADLGREFSRFADPKRIVTGFGAVASAHKFAPYVPTFSAGTPQTHTPTYNRRSFEDYINPLYEVMAAQQQQLQAQQDAQEKQQESQKNQHTEIFEAQNALIRDMFSSFESSFKSMMDAMIKMSETGKPPGGTFEDMKNDASFQKPINAPAINHKKPKYAVPSAPNYKKLAPKSPAANNNPIQIAVDPDTRKITRVSGD